ncbi:MAG: hypothetical protein AUG51_13350 [Acidobacteria bacterium 13_1_20CM_3_53_8]|nr:MAG: hypothetical protein AUG51_13350 [Acidobacteria bacterium 13_1_20CM_3_53_8]
MVAEQPRSTRRMAPGDARIMLEIRSVLDAQQAAWNRGDINGFMEGYERSPNTTFVSGDGVMRGWQTVLEQYKRSYDTRAKMGTLVFSELEVTPLGPNSAVVVGRWELVRADDRPNGRFTLILRRTARGLWRIVLDHTSSSSSSAAPSES